MARSCCAVFCALVVAPPAFLSLHLLVKSFSVWHDVFELPDTCSHTPLPANRSGLRVLVAGLQKTGTRTMIHSLNEIGLRSYHSEDFALLPSWDYAQQEWRRRNATWEQWYAGSGPSIGGLIHSYPQGGETLARAVSKCRVDGLAFDGMEMFYKPMVELSPDAKVIHLNWRKFDQWKTSVFNFHQINSVACLFDFFHTAALGVLPWAALATRVLDPILGEPLRGMLREGGPPITHICPPMAYLYFFLVNHRRHLSWIIAPGTFFVPENEEQFEAVQQDIVDSVPARQRIEWDFKRNTFEELCSFVGVTPCPRSGLLPKVPNTFAFQKDNPVAASVVLSVGLFFYWVNWRLACGLFGCCCRFRQDVGVDKKVK